MTGAILQFTRSTHQRVLESLPWFLTETLEENERDMVEQHILGCAHCRAELESQRLLREAVNRDEPTPGAEAALASLLPRLDATRPMRANRGTRGIRWILGLDRPIPVWAGLALTLQLGITVALVLTFYRTDQDAATYHVLAAADGPISAKGNLVVVFNPEAQLHTVQNILIASGARIVDGPLASGGYVLHAPQASLPTTLAWLRTQRAVALAERLDSEGAR